MPTSPSFQPGKFSPVVEVIHPDDVVPFSDAYGYSFDPSSEKDAYPNESVVQLRLSDDPTCFDNVTFPDGFPVTDAFAGVRCSVADTHDDTLHLSDFFSCPCFLLNIKAAETCYDPDVLNRLENHFCEACKPCTLVSTLKTPTPFHLDIPGYSPRPLNTWSDSLVSPFEPARVILFDKDFQLRTRLPDKYERRLKRQPLSLQRPHSRNPDLWIPARDSPILAPDPYLRWKYSTNTS